MCLVASMRKLPLESGGLSEILGILQTGLE